VNTVALELEGYPGGWRRPRRRRRVWRLLEPRRPRGVGLWCRGAGGGWVWRGRGHKLTKCGAQTYIKLGIYGYFTSIRKIFNKYDICVGIRGHLRKSGGYYIRVFGKVFVCVFSVVKMFEYFFEYFRILSIVALE